MSIAKRTMCLTAFLRPPPPIFQLRSSSLHPAWYPCIVTPAQKRNMRIIVETFIFCALKT